MTGTLRQNVCIFIRRNRPAPVFSRKARGSNSSTQNTAAFPLCTSPGVSDETSSTNNRYQRNRVKRGRKVFCFRVNNGFAHSMTRTADVLPGRRPVSHKRESQTDRDRERERHTHTHTNVSLAYSSIVCRLAFRKDHVDIPVSGGLGLASHARDRQRRSPR